MMSGDAKLVLVLLWHMHEPDFRDHATGEYALTQQPGTAAEAYLLTLSVEPLPD